jgi:hypothetical protein
MVLKQRNRQISFRVSEEEYERLREFCVSSGARSLSDVARCGLLEIAGLGANHIEDPLTGRMQTLDFRVRQLNRRVEQLADLMQAEPTGSKPRA